MRGAIANAAETSSLVLLLGRGPLQRRNCLLLLVLVLFGYILLALGKWWFLLLRVVWRCNESIFH